MATETIRTFLAGLVDYAGLFPPAGLEMSKAVQEFASHHRGEDSWVLGRFVLPVTRLEEFGRAARGLTPRGQAATPWQLSVLVDDLFDSARERIDSFNRAQAGRVSIRSVELASADAEEIARAARSFEGLEIFYELSHKKDPGPLMAAVATLGGRGKIRTGGITEGDFPPSAQLLRFMLAAHRCGISFKATAGLHHAVRGSYRLTYEKGSASGVMHGFLNVFLAAAWIHAETLGHEDLEALIEENDSGNFTFTDDEVVWGDHRLSLEELTAARREFISSYGSCSFSEPVAELRASKHLR